MSVINKDLVTVECGACGDAFDTARCNTGCGIMFCDLCQDGYDRAAESPFESALWEATR